MGSTSGNIRHPMGWEVDLAGAKTYGAKLRKVCTSCNRSRDLDVDMLIADHGPGYSLWDRSEPCPCGGKAFFTSSAGAVYRPMRSGAPSPEDRRIRHQELLSRLGLSPGDWARIKALAEAAGRATPTPPPVLDDLARPLKISAVPIDEAWRYSATQIATWKGAAILMWRMGARERADWQARTGFGR